MLLKKLAAYNFSEGKLHESSEKTVTSICFVGRHTKPNVFCSSQTEPGWVKDPRDYTWTVDSIVNPSPYFEQTLLSSFWGSSSSDVYVTSHTSGGLNIYHYNGERWAPIDLNDYRLRKGYRNKVFGFSNNDVWIAGGLVYNADGGYTASELIHFNGDEWVSIEFETRSELIDIWGLRQIIFGLAVEMVLFSILTGAIGIATPLKYRLNKAGSFF